MTWSEMAEATGKPERSLQRQYAKVWLHERIDRESWKLSGLVEPPKLKRNPFS
ncbi:MAG: hypothetical protein P1U89_05800 [Verrucomicrobiales bacterium]|nr:hypothetical protein [Verrucomicrobiales bacterium]